MNAPAQRKRNSIKGELIEPEVDGFVFKPPLCVFCNAPWTDDMMNVSTEAELENGWYGDYSITGDGVAHIDITCSSCGRLIYRKEIVCQVRQKW